MIDPQFFIQEAFEDMKNTIKPEITRKYMLLNELNLVPKEVVWLMMEILFYNTNEYKKYNELINNIVM